MTSPRVPLPGPDGRLKDKHLPSRLEKTALDQTYAPLTLVPDGITYNADGTVASSTEGGVTTTYTWNADGTCATETRLGLRKTWAYDGNGNPTSSTVTAV